MKNLASFTTFIFLLLGFTNTFTLQAQNRSNTIWLFGSNVQMDFSPGEPLLSRNNQFVSFNASSTISDPDSGELLLYSNGTRLWNGKGEFLVVTPLGTKHMSASQGVLIMPSDCQRRYLVFYTSSRELNENKIHDGVRYSLVDLDLDGGKGGIVPGQDYIQILDTASQQLTAIHHRDRRGYWVIVHGFADRKFYAFHVESDIVAQPVVSEVGKPWIGNYNQVGSYNQGSGIIKCSPDGNSLVLTSHTDNHISNGKAEIFNFDNNTGRVSTPVCLLEDIACMGAEFSPDSRKLYISCYQNQEAYLYQYSLDANDIPGSRELVFRHTVNRKNSILDGMQLAPNGKIYLSERALGQQGEKRLFVINQPNLTGVNADFSSIELPTNTYTFGGMINLYTGAELELEHDLLRTDLIQENDITICAGETVQLNVNYVLKGKYSWTPDIGLSDPGSPAPDASPKQTTKYYLRYEGKCSEATDSVTVFVKPVPALEVSKDQVICLEDSVQLQAMGALDYRWSPAIGLSATDISNPVAAPIEPTVYTVVGRNALGCEDSTQIFVNVLQLPDFDLGPDLSICPGKSVRIRATGGIAYRWWPDLEISPTQSDFPRVSPSEDRTYYVEVTNREGCSRIDSIRVSVGAEIKLPPGKTYNICRGESVKLDIEGPEGEYTWSPVRGLDDHNIKQPTAQPETNTVYTVTLHSDCGAKTAQIEVKILDVPNTRLSNKQICQGQSVELNPDGDPTNTHLWDANPLIDDRTVFNPSVQVEETTVFYVTVDNSGCQKRDSVRVSIKAAPPLQVSRDLQICAGGTIQLQAEGADEYEWTPQEGLSDPTSATPLVTLNESRTYYVRGTTVDGCQGLDSVRVDIVPGPQVSLEPLAPSICSGEFVQVQLQSDMPLQTVRWTPAIGLDNPESQNPLIRLSASQEYKIEYESQDGCRGNLTYRVEVKDPPRLTIDPPLLSLCEDANGLVIVSGAERYEWYDVAGRLIGTGNSRRFDASIDAAGVYRVRGSNGAGCTASTNVEVRILEDPKLQARTQYEICHGESITLLAEGATRYEWSPAESLSDPRSPSPRASPLQDQEYHLRVFNDNGCSDSSIVSVRVAPRLDIQLVAEGSAEGVLPGDKILLRLNVKFDASATELMSLQRFQIQLEYDAAELDYLPQSLESSNDLNEWTLSAAMPDGRGNLTIDALGNGQLLPKAFSIELRMHVLLFSSGSEVIPVGISSADFGQTDVCANLGTIELNWSEVCFHDYRSLTYSGTRFGLQQNQPNPAGGSTEIVYRLGFDSNVHLVLSDNLGRVIRVLDSGPRAAGEYSLQLDTSELAAGLYRYSLGAGPFSASRLLIVK